MCSVLLSVRREQHREREQREEKARKDQQRDREQRDREQREREQRDREQRDREQRERERELQARETREREETEKKELERKAAEERGRIEEQLAAERAVHKHFEASLLLAQQKVRHLAAPWQPLGPSQTPAKPLSYLFPHLGNDVSLDSALTPSRRHPLSSSH